MSHRRLSVPGLMAAFFPCVLGCAARGPAAVGQPPPQPKEGEFTVRFRDRTIDLAPFYEGFPYRSLTPDYAAGRIFYFHDRRDGRRFLSVPLDGRPADLARGTPVVAEAIDWNGRTFDGLRALPDGAAVFLGDERNDEVLNLFHVDRQGRLRRLTDRQYVYGFGLDPARRRIAYLPRQGQTEPFETCLVVHELAGGMEKEIVCDRPDLRLTWGDPVFTPDGRGVLLNVNHDGDRKRASLAFVDLDRPLLAPLLPALPRHAVFVADGWVDPRTFAYVSDESGFTELWTWDLGAGRARRLTSVGAEIATGGPQAVAVVRLGGQRAVALVWQKPYASTLALIDPLTGRLLRGRDYDATVDLAAATDERLVLQSTSHRQMLRLEELRFDPAARGEPPLADGAVPDGLPLAEPPAAVRGAVERCAVRRVAIPTFDVDPATGAPRLLHAFVLTPRQPSAGPAHRFAVVQSFYGGENRFDPMAQIICAAGGSFIAPAVRGSAGFGSAFSALNDHDLGGDEIVDLGYVARWAARELGLREHQIGLWGRSHGGYATMRALTFPEGTNGHRERFAWGFGMSDAGFSDILTFYETCNIPDWVTLEAGDPVKERARLRDRSPLAHVDLLAAPLLLTHGENDNRVPVRESRQFFARARALGKPVTYVEFPGQGHRVKGLGGEQMLWRARLGFLEGALPSR